MIKNLLGFSLSTWIGAILTFLIAPIASHVYSSGELGIINYYYSVVNIVFTLLLMGMDQAYIRFYPEIKDKSSRKTIFTFGIYITVCVAVLFSLVGLPFREKIAKWITGSASAPVLIMMAFHVIGLTVVRYYVIIYRVTSRLLPFTIASIFNTALLKFVYIFGSPIQKTANFGIATTAIVTVIAAFLYLIFGRHELSISNFMQEHDWYRKEFQYAMPIIPTMLIAIININIPQIFIRSFFGFDCVAFYSIGLTLASTITLLSTGINTFLEPYIYANYREKQSAISKILSVFVRSSVFLGIGLALFQDVFFFFFSKEYITVTKFMPILIASALWNAIGDFYNIGVKIEKRTKDNIPIYVIGIAVNLLLCIVLIPITQNMGAAISAAVASLVMCAMKKSKGCRYYPIEEKKRIFTLGVILLVACAALNALFWGTAMRYIALTILWISAFFLLELNKYTLEFIARFKQRKHLQSR